MDLTKLKMKRDVHRLNRTMKHSRKLTNKNTAGHERVKFSIQKNYFQIATEYVFKIAEGSGKNTSPNLTGVLCELSWGRGGARGSRYLAVYVRFAVVAMEWNGEHRALFVDEYIHNDDSVITTQRAFRIWFQLGRHYPVPDRKTIHV
ncbi:hypothetical protein TNIN_387801 [Trichonephila inaurata madagascariensis]|uniref:DUF4817 domain-containing protein n=1 Tax=Trichonephila inaurata madagascariensis TaxID=2747483 RepID=A0A8X7CHG6_9ARAC|nr:hypothetical protein TNIN_387801 [Trichonephila inaurata madagascariensis]